MPKLCVKYEKCDLKIILILNTRRNHFFSVKNIGKNIIKYIIIIDTVNFTLKYINNYSKTCIGNNSELNIIV